MDLRRVVFVVDDDAATRGELRETLERAQWTVETFSSGDRLLERDLDDPSLVACLLLDLDLPGMGGLGLQERLNRARVAIPIVFLSDLPEVALAVQALQAGAIDYLQKPVPRDVLIPRVERALAIAANWRDNRLRRADFQARLAELSIQERRVCFLLLDGKNNKEIAADLGVGLPTVTKHRARVLQKIGVKNPVELAKLATRCAPELCAPVTRLRRDPISHPWCSAPRSTASRSADRGGSISRRARFPLAAKSPQAAHSVRGGRGSR